MFENFTASDWAGWVGAITGSLALMWEIYTWWSSGPKVKLDIGTNMKFSGPRKDNKTYVTIRAVNTGDQPTTLTNLGFVHYKGFFQYLRNKPKQSYVVPVPITANPIPYKLEPGTIWDGNILQNDEIENFGKDGCLAIHLYHSHSKKPIKGLVRFHNVKES